MSTLPFISYTCSSSPVSHTHYTSSTPPSLPINYPASSDPPESTVYNLHYPLLTVRGEHGLQGPESFELRVEYLHSFHHIVLALIFGSELVGFLRGHRLGFVVVVGGDSKVPGLILTALGAKVGVLFGEVGVLLLTGSMILNRRYCTHLPHPLVSHSIHSNPSTSSWA